MSEQQPVFHIERIYLKDLSLEIPNAPQVFAERENPRIDINLHNEARGLDAGIYEVVLTATVTAKVKDKTALGLNLSREGKKDIALFIDKKTHLICKIEMRTRDLMSGQEVTEERFITEYQELAGNKVAKKVEVLRDGKALLEAEVLEVQAFEKFDDSEFAQPK